MATNLEDALTVLRFASTTMMKRYAELEELGLQNFLDLPERGQALLVMIDELGELLSPSGVKALAASTLIPTPLGLVPLSSLSVGDEVLDVHGRPTEVLNKYEPVEQERYALQVSEDSTGRTQDFVAGSEHYWVAYFEAPDGSVTGPQLVETKDLYVFQEEQEKLPPEERTKAKFKRYKGYKAEV